MVSRIGLFSWPPWGGWYLVLGGGRILRRDSHGQLKCQGRPAAQKRRQDLWWNMVAKRQPATRSSGWMGMDMRQVSQTFKAESDAVVQEAQDPASLGLASAEACFQDNMMQAPWSQEMIGMKLIGRDELTTW